MASPRYPEESPLDPALNVLSGDVVDAALKVHRHLGPGLLESAYRTCLQMELRKRGHKVEVEVPVPIHYEGEPAGVGFRLDLIVDDALVVEVKAAEELHPVHTAQLLTYLRLTDRPLGLLLNFHHRLLREGIKRIIHTPHQPRSVASVESKIDG